MRLSPRNAVAAASVCLVSISGITKIRTSSILNERLGVSPVSYVAIEGNQATTTSGAQQAGNEFPQVIQDYIKFHNETKFKPGAKYLIWRCRRDEQPCGGIGDRIKGIMSALYTAICTGRIILIDCKFQSYFLDWPSLIAVSMFAVGCTLPPPTYLPDDCCTHL